MTNEQLTTILSGLFPEAGLKQGPQYLEMTVTADKLHAVAGYLKENAELAFDFLFCLSAVDYPEYHSVVYHLESTAHKHYLVLKTNTSDRQSPTIDTVCDIWPTAEFHEREAYDLMGIRFNNHPDLRRMFLDENWGHPLRKDYVDDIHIVER